MARTRAVDHDVKKRAILDFATKLFAREGYERASMAQIALEGKVSKALVYHYFVSKEQLLFDVIAAHLDELCQLIENENDASLDPEENLLNLVKLLLQTYSHADIKHRVIINELTSLQEDKQELLRAKERYLVNIVANAILKINPDLNDDVSLLKPITMSLFGMLNWNYMWFKEDGEISREQYAEIVTQLTIRGVREKLVISL